MKFSQSERERRIDAALAEGRYRVMSRYPAGDGTDMAVLALCHITNGHCDVCGADKIGGEGCVSLTQQVAPDAA
jgi:hypothetical protein